MKKLSLIAIIFVLAIALVSCSNASTEKADTDVKNDKVIEKPVINEEPEKEIVTLTLYFPDNDVLYLHPEKREVEVEKGQLLAEVVLEELFRGPKDEELAPGLDGENLVNSVKVENGLCTVDFASDFILLNSGGSTREAFAIGSIVNSLCELDGIEEVKIDIDGNKSSEFGGHFTLDEVFLPQTDLIAKQ
ncbi:MAG: GerMN domain-containing protein [Clostridia bacterium]|nr:GerMN domain-containing protein [Clostridia bacterium]